MIKGLFFSAGQSDCSIEMINLPEQLVSKWFPAMTH